MPAASGAMESASRGRALRLWGLAAAVLALVLVPVLIGTASPIVAALAGLLCVAALILVYEASDTEMAVLAVHVVWIEAGSLGWLFKKD